jgi:type III secretory pathway component EscU
MPTFEYGKSLKNLILLAIAFFALPILQLMNVIPKMAFILLGMAVLVFSAFTVWTLFRTAVFHLLYTMKNTFGKKTDETEDTPKGKKSWARYDNETYEEDTHS